LEIMDRSIRRLGHLLVVMGVMLGAVSGIALGLVVKLTQTSRVGRVPGAPPAAVLAVSQPPVQTTPGPRRVTGGGDPSGTQRAASADQAVARDDAANNHSSGRHGGAERSKSKPGDGNHNGHGKNKGNGHDNEPGLPTSPGRGRS
jgi:hypothetical protein